MQVGTIKETMQQERMAADQELASLQQRVTAAENRAADADTERAATDVCIAALQQQLIEAQRKAADAEQERVAANARADALEEYTIGSLSRVPNA